MRKLIAPCLLLCALAGAAAADDFGRSYDTFQSLYADNVNFINENTGRHLLPHKYSASFDTEGKRFYAIASGALYSEIYLDDMFSQIASCKITLQAPEGMSYGDSKHADFTVAGYHSYALIMAMHDDESAAGRYRLVEDINAGLAAGNGEYTKQVGDYRLTCRSEGSSVTMLFENELLMGKETETEDETDPQVEITLGK